MSNPLLHTRKAMRGLLCFLLLSCLVQAEVKAQTPASRSHQVQAAFLYHFTQFIKWPSSSFSDPSAPFVIGIIGTDPFGAYLDKLLAGEKVNGRPIRVHRYSNTEEMRDCHILFINQPVSSSLLTECINRGVLTVSNNPDFVDSRGIVRFFTEQNKIRFEINLPLAKNARLEVSSKLLRLARVIEK